MHFENQASEGPRFTGGSKNGTRVPSKGAAGLRNGPEFLKSRKLQPQGTYLLLNKGKQKKRRKRQGWFPDVDYLVEL